MGMTDQEMRGTAIAALLSLPVMAGAAVARHLGQVLRTIGRGERGRLNRDLKNFLGLPRRGATFFPRP